MIMNRNFGKLNTTRKNLNLQLDLNQNFKDASDLSLVDAENIKIANDGEYILSNNSIRIVKPIYDAITEHLKHNSNPDYRIIYVLPCNNELIVFVCAKGYSKEDENKLYLNLFRYNEKTDICKVCLNFSLTSDETGLRYRNGGLPYYGGEFTGTFTYNANNDLIIAICEYDSKLPTPIDVGQPMMIINLGHWNEDETEIINNSNLNPKTFPLCPEVELPNPYNVEIINGYSKKGWYNFFIRYKIDDYNYTKWYSIGDSIYLDELKKQTLFDHYQGEFTDAQNQENIIKVNHSLKIYDYISDELDVCSKTIKFNLDLDKIYKYYQIGFTCSTKTYIESKNTKDIDINLNNFVLNYSDCDNIDKNEFILNYQNYFNVKNIINYNNRIYISNYKEYNILNEELINKIKTVKCLFNLENKELNFDNECFQFKIKNIDDEYRYVNNNITVKNLINSKNTNPNKFYLTYKKENNFIIDFLEINTVDEYRNAVNDLIITKFNINLKDTTNYIYIENRQTNEYRIAYIDNLTINYDNAENGYSFFDGTKNTKSKLYVYLLKKYYLNDKTYIYNKENNKLRLNVDEEYDSIYFAEYKYKKVYFVDTNFSTKNLYLASIQTKCGVPLELDIYDIKNRYFNDINKINYSLVPGNIYKFYIHFLDKYGNVSEGLELNINYDLKIINNKEYVCLFSRKEFNRVINLYYLYFDINKKLISNGVIDTSCITYVYRSTTGYERIYNYEDLNEKNKQIVDNAINNIINYIDNIDSDVIGNLLKNIIYNKELDEGSLTEDNYENRYFSSLDKTKYLYVNNHIKYFYCPNDGINCNKILNLDLEYILSDIKYNKYFISYEKLDNLLLYQGITSYGIKLFDNIYDNVEKSSFECYNTPILDFNLYNDFLNINDSIKLKGNFCILTKEEILNNENFTIILQNTNKDKDYDSLKHNNIEKIEYVVANSNKDNNLNQGTKLILKNIFSNYTENSTNKEYYICKVYNNTSFNNTFIKTLIRCTNYINDFNIRITTYSHWTEGSAILFHKLGYRYDSEKHIKTYDNSTYYGDSIPILNIKFLQIVDDFQEFKQFNNPPQSLVIIKNNVNYDDKSAQYYYGTSFLCQDTVDLFKNNTLKHDDSIINIYTNYDETRLNKINYDKTVRRSNYIKDESLEIGWRKFELDNYKNITENKGNITNIIGIGDLLLVHTEHSLFQFDKNNLLVAANKSVQLGQQDTFDVEYKEIFTSNFGFGGLQNKNSFIIGEFGYIYYNSDFCKLYCYDAGQINDIGVNIYAFLNQFRPSRIDFVEDKENKLIYCRILLDFDEITLMYNYDKKTFISKSSFPFIKGYNTKIKSYFIDNFEENNQIYKLLFNKDSIYSNVCSRNKLINNKFEIYYLTNTFTFIINPNYDKLKVLNSISYKLYKRDTYNIQDNYNIKQPIPEFYDPITKLVPYSGETLRIYNDICDTEDIDISENSKGTPNNIPNYEKPYWNFGEFNFNYFRNKKIGGSSRIVGNYFLIQFKFTIGKTDLSLIEFQSLNYSVTEY